MGFFSFLSFGKKNSTPAKPKFYIRGINELSAEEKAKLNIQYESLKARLEKEAENNRKLEDERVKKANTECPHCKSKNVNNRIKRFQGDIKVSNSGSISGIGILGTGIMGGSFSSNIRGEFDTNEVNKCNDCENEWKVEKASWHSFWLDDLGDRVIDFLRIAHHAYNDKIEWNPNKLGEKFASAEEKRQDEIAKIPQHWFAKQTKEYFKDYSLELVKYVVEEEYLSNRYSSTYDCERWLEFSKEPLHTLLEIPFLK